MKYLFAIILLSVLTFQSFGQRTSNLKAGIGLPIFLGNISGETEISKVTSLPTFSVEKPIAIEIQRQEKICINPGVAFFYFKEKEYFSNSLTMSTKNLNHMSFNGYVKFLYQQEIQRRSKAFIYFGAITGVHIYSSTKGEKIIESQNEQNPYFKEDVNEKGKDFFNSIYYGAVLGFQPNLKITNKLVPSFELSFYPNFITKQTGEKASAVQISVFVGIND